METIKQWRLLTVKQQSYYIIITKSGLLIFKTHQMTHNKNNSLACYAPMYTD